VDTDSDLDLLVIMPDSRPGKEWIDKVYSEVDCLVKTDFIIFNSREYSEDLPHNSFLRDIASTGRVVL